MEVGVTNSEAYLNIGEFKIQNSITVNRNNPNAIDKIAPLPFLDWIPHFAGLQSDPRILLLNYKQYVLDWQKVTVDTQM